MTTSFEDRQLNNESCPRKYGPEERKNIFHSTRNEFFEDLSFQNCDFTGCGLTTYGVPIARSHASRIRLENCRANGFFGTGAVFEDISISGFGTGKHPVVLSGCVFRHVKISGKCGRFLINAEVDTSDSERSDQFKRDNAAIYENVDWALDLTGLETSGFELRGSVPVQLIRRNEEEQFVMHREVAIGGGWREFDPFSSFDLAIQFFLESQAEQELFVAPRLSKHFKQEIEYYRRLREAGLMD